MKIRFDKNQRDCTPEEAAMLIMEALRKAQRAKRKTLWQRVKAWLGVA